MTPLPWTTWQEPDTKVWRIDHKISRPDGYKNSIIVGWAGDEEDAKAICAAQNDRAELMEALRDASQLIDVMIPRLRHLSTQDFLNVNERAASVRALLARMEKP